MDSHTEIQRVTRRRTTDITLFSMDTIAELYDKRGITGPSLVLPG